MVQEYECARTRARAGGWLTFFVVVESQTEFFSSALAVRAFQLRGRKIVQFHFLHQERARHDGTAAAPARKNNEHGLSCRASHPLCHFNGTDL